MNEEIKKRILYLSSRGLSQFGIATRLNISYWEAQQVIEEDIKKDFDGAFQ